MEAVMRRRRLALLLGMAVAAAGVSVVAALPASAATGCRVDYTVGSQWAGGFTANVALTNLGDPVSAWTLTWSFGAGQQVTQAWNATVTQSGSPVSAADVSYNGALATNGGTSFGFNGSWTSTYPVPSQFAHNATASPGSCHRVPTATP